MNEITAACICIVTFLLLVFSGLMFKQHKENELSIEAVKAGLVQKREGNYTIWVKP